MNELNGVVRIVSNKHIGTGFVVSSDGLIATCAHVLGSPRPEKATVIFQSTGTRQDATVIAEWWRASDAEDIAFLKIDGDLPEGIQVLPLGSCEGTSGHDIRSFGYPAAGEVEGIQGVGKSLGLGSMTTGGYKLLQLRSSEITKGFSGAPVWDTSRQRVIGMVVIATEPDKMRRLGETAFATPAEMLQTVCPALHLSEICPYRDLAVFTEDDAHLFFGRKTLVDELVKQLQNNRRFLAVLGASGSGKSSVVQAGLIPQIRDGAVPGSKHWQIVLTRPTDSSFQSQLINLETTHVPVALVIDQFEELFVSYENDVREEIIARLIKLLDYSPHVTLILVMRDDFYSRLIPYEPMKRWIDGARVSIPPMIDREEVEAIVREPACLVGWQFEEGLVELIIKDVLNMPTRGLQKVGSSTLLPLLEVALTQLWQAREDGLLTRKAYQYIGGVTGSLTRRAEETYTGFDERLRPLVQYIFEALIYLGNPEQGVPDSRRRRSVSSLYRTDDEIADIDSIIRQLVDKRLLATSQGDQSQPVMVEVVHDALLWEWSRLQQWVDEDRPFLLWRQELERRVRAWVDTNRDEPAKRDVDKLVAASDLREALQWMEKRAAELSQSERDFIQASGEQQKRYTRRTVLVGLAGLGLAGASVTGSILLFERNKAPSQPRPARPLPYSYTGHSGPAFSVAWSPDGKHLASASADQTVQVWDATYGTRLFTYRGHSGPVTSVAWSPDGKRLASASADQTVQVWDAASGSRLFTYTGHTNTVDSVAWSPDGKRLASASQDKTVRIWLWLQN